MAYRPNTRGRALLILIGDGASPETFVHPCWLSGERGVARETQVSEEIDRDCDAPYLPGWMTRVINGKSATITGAGRFKRFEQDMFDEWQLSGEARNVRVMIGSGEDAPMYEGAFKLTRIDLRGGDAGTIAASMTLVSEGSFVPLSQPPAGFAFLLLGPTDVLTLGADRLMIGN